MAPRIPSGPNKFEPNKRTQADASGHDPHKGNPGSDAGTDRMKNKRKKRWSDDRENQQR